MPTITYDPVLATTEPPRPPAPPHPGTALVLELGTAGPLVVLPGERVVVHDYRRAHLVDLANHELALEATLPSRDPSSAFGATVSFHCQVTHPAMVAVNGIRDLTAAVRPRLVRILATVARRYGVLDAEAAEAAMNSALDRYLGNSAVRLGDFRVGLRTARRRRYPTTSPTSATRYSMIT